MFAALFAILLQAFTVQTHVHAFAAPIAGAERADGAVTDTAHVSLHRETSCVFCEALTTTGRAALPTPPVVDGERASPAETAPPVVQQASRTPSHAWRSRAPPSLL